MESRSDSPCPGRLTRRTATVTISAPEASMASRMFSKDAYFPVPTIRRDLNSLPPSHSDVSYISPSSAQPPPIGRTISTRSPSRSTDWAYWCFGVTSRFTATAVYSRRTFRRARSPSMVSPSGSSIGLPLTMTFMEKTKPHLGGCGGRRPVSRVAFPSLELSRSGSRGPGPHPVLRKPPPAPHASLYLSLELAGEVLGPGHGHLADIAPAEIGGGLAAHRRALGQQRKPGRGGRALGSARHHPVGQIAPEHHPQQGIDAPGVGVPGPHEGDLGRRAQVEVERAEIPAEARRVTPHEIGHGTEGLERDRLVALLAAEEPEAKQPVDGGGRACGHGVVEEVAGSAHQGFLIDARVEEGLPLAVPEEAQCLLGEAPRLVQPAPVEGRLVERQE